MSLSSNNPRAYREPEVRRLKLHYLHHPRCYQHSSQPWELHRGFRIRVLTPHALALFVGQPPRDSDLLSRRPEPGEDSFLILPAPHGASPLLLKEALSLCAGEGWAPQVTLVLSDEKLLKEPPSGLRRALRAAVPKSYPGLALWVWQEMPAPLRDDLDFFNAEQILHQLGRMGRRVARRMKWRRFLP